MAPYPILKEENAPKDAPDYCIQGCPKADTCPYNAVRLYLDDKENDWFRTTSTREANPTDEMVETALRTTQYGKCVFKCDNDVVDHQTVNMIFEDDITVTFTMNPSTKAADLYILWEQKGNCTQQWTGSELLLQYMNSKQSRLQKFRLLPKMALRMGMAAAMMALCTLFMSI